MGSVIKYVQWGGGGQFGVGGTKQMNFLLLGCATINKTIFFAGGYETKI